MSTTNRDAAFFFGEPGRRLFGWYHAPVAAQGNRAHGVVVCNPIGDDATRAHRPLRHLAEMLAREGFAVLRFDFDGTGDSDGDESDPDRVATWIGDVARAAAELKKRSGVERISIAGLRFGATLAVAAANAGLAVDELVLWAPYDTGTEFAADVTQVHRTHVLLEPASFAGGPPATGGREALGFFLSDATLRELDGVGRETPRERPARATLVIDTRNVPGESALAERLRRLGVEVTSAHLPGQKFLITSPHTGRLPSDILETIVRWLAERHPLIGEGPRVPASPPRAPREPRDEHGERPLRFGPSDRLFGIHHRPAAKAGPDVPAIIMLNAGCAPRTGAHRLYVRLARRWADLGFHVLRMDLSGIGDSPAVEGCPENVTYPRSGLDDVRAAMDRLQSIARVGGFVVLGLCSGADIAFQLGLEADRVRGVMMLNPRTFLVHDLGMVDGHFNAAWYSASLRRGASWRKLLRGEVDLARVARILAPRVKSAIGEGVERFVQLASGLAALRGGNPEAKPPDRDVPRSLRRMVERGVDTYLLVADPDPGVHYVDSTQGRAMRALHSLRGFRRTGVAGTDHTFTALWAQARVGDLLTEHLVTRHLVRAAVGSAA